MTTKRLTVLLAVLLLGLGAVFLLPKAPRQQPVGVNFALPDFIGTWIGQDEQVTEQEHLVLGSDTEFARKVYTGSRNEKIYVTIVLAGQDMNTSIHRAERCLRAQGWNILDSRIATVALGQPANAQLKVTRLRNSHAAWGKDALDYYWFVGSTDLTPSHVERSLIDWRDRIFKGYNQRWAYVSVVCVLPDNLTPEIEKEIDGTAESFIKQLAPKIHKASVKYST
jgi:hypothetical protein